jgi:hypothetical protein
LTGLRAPGEGRRVVTTEVLIRRVNRIGVRTVEREGEQYFVAIQNRSYRSRHAVTIETARRHYAALNREGRK